MGFLHISKLQVNVSVTIFLVSNSFQNILDGFASCIAFMVKKIFTKSYLPSLGTQEFLGKLRNLKDYFLGVYPNVCFHICSIHKSA